eukprot:gene28839-32028_t
MEHAPTLIDSNADPLQRRVRSRRNSFSPAPTDPIACLKGAPYAREMQAAVDAVRIAARLCKAVQHQLCSMTEKMEKVDDSPVTVADYGAQALVAWSLSKQDPKNRLSMVAEEDSHTLRSPSGQGIVERITQLVNSVLEGEEGATPLTANEVLELIDLGDSPGGPSGRHWVLDPIDGTKGFVGMRQYAICLALIQDGEVVVGVLGCPNITQSPVTEEDGGPSAMAKAKESDNVGSVFFAHQGYGAYVAPMWGNYSLQTLPNIQRIHVDDVPAPFTNARFMGAYEPGHSNHGFSAALASKVGVSLPPFLMDSQAKYGILSRGDASVFMRFPPPSYREKIWDHAAGFVIVEEAGGKVTDAHGQRLDFSQGRELDTYGGIVAGPPLVHSAVLAAVLELGGPHNH